MIINIAKFPILHPIPIVYNYIMSVLVRSFVIPLLGNTHDMYLLDIGIAFVLK